MDTKPGYSEWVPDFYQATVEKITTVPAESGGQNYKVLLTIPRNSATRDLGDFVGQPVMVAIKSVQARLPEKPRETMTATITAQTTRPPIVLDEAVVGKPLLADEFIRVDEATGEVMDSVTFSAGGHSATIRAGDLS